MNEITVIIIAVLVLATLYFFANEFYNVAKEKGFYEKKYLWIAFIFSIFGYLLIIALPDRKTIKISDAYKKPFNKDETSYGTRVSGFSSGAMDIPKRKQFEEEI